MAAEYSRRVAAPAAYDSPAVMSARFLRRARTAGGAMALAAALATATARASGPDACPAIDLPADFREVLQDPPAPSPARPSVPAVVGRAVWSELKRYGSDTAALVAAPFHWDAQDGWRAAGA